MTYTFDVQESKLWSALKATGMLREARVALDGCDGETVAWVDLSRPDIEVAGGMGLSTEWAMEYREDELPGLKEGNEIYIAGVLYQVRQAPVVEEAGTGFFRIALLTRISPC